jgi:protein archease
MSGKSPYGYETVEHTADLAVKLVAKQLPDLYHYAALSLSESLIGLSAIEPKEIRRFEARGQDLEDLLVRMLQKLLGAFSAENFVYSEVVIEALDNQRILLMVKGEPFDPARHAFKIEIKGATYHGLRILQTDLGYEATVVFDV